MKPIFKTHKNFSYSLAYAGAATDADLSKWFVRVMANTGNFAAIIVSGDDSFVVVSWEGQLFTFEGDATMYDQSESFGPLGVAWKACRRLGVDSSTIKLLSELAHNSYTVRSKDPTDQATLRINKRNRPIRDTGGADTSLGNSLVMGLSWFYVFRKMAKAQDFSLMNAEKRFQFLGLKMKIKKLDPYQGTFLKGMWYHTDQGPYWGPLPSRYFKMGKALRDPREVYKVKNFEVAARSFLNDVACSYSLFISVPLIRQFITNFKKCSAIDLQISIYQINAATDPKPLLISDAYEQLNVRYGISPSEWADAEKLLPSVPFVFFCHPVFDKLAAVDC